jgi:pimeloyl-ACP methyl ester carboxylesterase
MSDSMVMRSEMIDLPDGRFHYISWGAERAELPAALLLHGITSSALSWVRVGPELADRYRGLCPRYARAWRQHQTGDRSL